MLPLLEIFLLAVASMFWPLLLVVVVVALNTPHPLPLLSWFYAGGMITTVSVGAAMVFAFRDSSFLSRSDASAAPWVHVIAGALALVAALVLRRVAGRAGDRRPAHQAPKKSRSSEWVERLLARGRGLAFVGGIAATIFPAPFAIIAMFDIAQLDYSAAASVLLIVAFYVIMFTFVEVPIVSFVVAPEWTKTTAGRFNAWLGRNLVQLAIWALTALGTAEIVRGIVSAIR